VASDAKQTFHPPASLVAGGLALLTLLTLSPVLGNGFVNYDDPIYVTVNEAIRTRFSAASVRRAMTAMEALNWHPLTWMSLQLDYRLYELKPLGYHLTNLMLHLASTLILFGALNAMTGGFWRSALVAALFAVHPLHVESVAWVAERKDVLSGFFWMLTMAAYARYARAPNAGSYVLVAVCLTLGLMAKPMLVTLPCVLLLLDYWPLRRAEPGTGKSIGWLVVEKLPLFALAAGASVLTWNAQQAGGAIESLESYPLGSRIENALVSYVRYIGMAIWPSGLAVFYPHPGSKLQVWQVVGAGALLIVITAGTIALRRRAPYFLVGWLWYGGTLVPVIGLVQVGQQALADRYTYIPLIGVFITVAWSFGDLLIRCPDLRIWAIAATAAAVMACAVGSWRQARHWKDSVSLWEHALSVTPDNYTVRNALGRGLLEENGSAAAAEEHFRAALELRPGYVKALGNLGRALARQEKNEEAILWYQRALEIEPDSFETRNNLGIALAKCGRLDEAIEQLQETVRLAPDYEEARLNLERALDAKSRARP
jgi:tetratricopeptide (TPR) repeat protein